MSMSMSMSMPMSMTASLEKNRIARIRPIAPSLRSFSSSSDALDNTDTFEGALTTMCIGLPSQTIPSVIEVELADDEEIFADNLAQALTNALSHKYSTCLSPQYPEDSVGPSNARRIEFEDNNEVLMGTIDVENTKLGCSIQSNLAISCHLVNATIYLFGEDINETIHPLLHSITTNSGSFHEELIATDIVSVRVQDNEGDTETSNSSSQIDPTSTSSSRKIIVTIILSLMTVILVAIAVFVLRNIPSCCHKNSVAHIPSRKIPAFIEHHEINITFDQEDQADIDIDIDSSSDSDSDSENYRPTIPTRAAYI